MRPNHYEPVLQKWQSDLIIARARRMGFRGHDLLDAQQEVALAVMLFRFDLAKSNGAAETTALTALIDRQLKTMLRAKVPCSFQKALISSSLPASWNFRAKEGYSGDSLIARRSPGIR